MVEIRRVAAARQAIRADVLFIDVLEESNIRITL